MTTGSETMGSAALNEEMFHVKQHVLLRTLSLFQCAPETPAEPAELVLRMFQLHEQRPREVVSMLRSPCLNLQKPAQIASFPG